MMNLTHGLDASSRPGADPYIHPIALYRRSVLVKYRHRQLNVFVLLNCGVEMSIQFVLEGFKVVL